MDFFAPVRITGTRVALEPLSMRHVDDLAVAGADEAIWRWLPTAHYQPGSMRAFVESALVAQERRAALPFATIDLLSGTAVGSTRYHHIDTEHRRLEIGMTWIGLGHQRSHINTEAKLLQFWYAIDILKCRRVELKADVNNAKSRAAILDLGRWKRAFSASTCCMLTDEIATTSTSRSLMMTGRQSAHASKAN